MGRRLVRSGMDSVSGGDGESFCGERGATIVLSVESYLVATRYQKPRAVAARAVVVRLVARRNSTVGRRQLFMYIVVRPCEHSPCRTKVTSEA